MSTVKKIIGGIAEGVGEFVKEGAKDIAETVNPAKMVEQAIGPKKTSNEFTEYLRSLGGNLTDAEVERKRKEFEEKQKTEMSQAENIIKQALPDHLKPKPAAQEPSIYERNIQEEEMKKARAVEAQKKQPKTISAPTGKVTGVLGGRKRPKSSDFEAGKNIKIG